jgi:ATP-dependent DNA helicase RecQ
VVMPTGGGKSVCFQLPALLNTGVTLVVSPLVALMENQVTELQQKRLSTALLHSELPTYQRKQTLLRLEKNQLRLLYLSPETLLSSAVWNRLVSSQVQINSMILDEAHCLVQWGDTFRPVYQRLGAVRPALLRTKPEGTQITIAAFTATADPQTQQTIQRVLKLENPKIILQSPYRDNLHLSVQIAWTARGRRQQLRQLIQSKSQQAGLVYVRTRREGEALAEWLSQRGYSTAAYHAGLSPEVRRSIESSWLKGDIPFVVCTSAFGMGINHPHVRYVVHFHVPEFLSEYVQEIGRAGRDGKPAEAVSLISEPTGWLDPTDRQRQQYFQQQRRKQLQTAQQLRHKLPKHGDVNIISRQFPQGAVTLALLHSQGQLQWHDPFHYELCDDKSDRIVASTPLAKPMWQYLNTRDCRWQFLLSSFGFSEAANQLGNGCGHCDICDRKA